MPHIALITYEMNQGGTNRVLCELANGFADAGHIVTVLCCTSAGALDSRFREQLSPAVHYHALSDVAWSSRSWGQIRSFLKFRRWIRANTPDIILATGNNISWFSGLGVMLADEPSPKLYIKTTNPIVRSRDLAPIKWIRRIVYGYLFGRSDGVMTLSHAETRLLQSQFPQVANKFSSVYNAYVTDRHDDVGTAEVPPPWIIMAAGRLAAQKNFSRLLEAFALLGSEVRTKNIVLHIAGDGEERALLERRVEELGIADRVKFLGFQSNVTQLMASAHLFVLSSDYEGLPAVVIEALAVNCPVISTDCFVNAHELLDGLPGCAVCDCTSEALAAALQHWFSAPVIAAELKTHTDNYTTPSSVKSHLAAMGEA